MLVASAAVGSAQTRAVKRKCRSSRGTEKPGHLRLGLLLDLEVGRESPFGVSRDFGVVREPAFDVGLQPGLHKQGQSNGNKGSQTEAEEQKSRGTCDWGPGSKSTTEMAESDSESESEMTKSGESPSQAERAADGDGEAACAAARAARRSARGGAWEGDRAAGSFVMSVKGTRLRSSPWRLDSTRRGCGAVRSPHLSQNPVPGP